MDLGALLTPAGLLALPSVAGALAMWALAGWLLVLHFDGRVHRAFSVFLVFRGCAAFGAAVYFASLGSDVPSLRLAYYAHLGALVAMLHFVSVYPRPRGWGRWPRGGLVPVVLLAVLVAGFAFARCTLFLCAPGFAGTEVAVGPLAVLSVSPTYNTLNLVMAFAGFLVLRDALAFPEGRRRSSALLVGAIFALNGLFDGVRALQAWEALLRDQAVLLGPVSPWPFAVAAHVLAGLTLVPAAAAIVYASTGPSALRGEGRRRLLAGAALALLSGAATLAFRGPGDLADTALTGAWRLAIPVAVTYAIVRLQLFDIDVKVKWTLKQSTLAAVFVGVFFVVSEGAQAVFSTSANSELVGIAGAGLLVFALAPLQRAAERVADVALPNVKPMAALGAEDRARIYLENARQAWSDGSINRDERAMLDRLRASLGLPAEEAMRLEAEAAR